MPLPLGKNLAPIFGAKSPQKRKKKGKKEGGNKKEEEEKQAREREAALVDDDCRRRERKRTRAKREISQSRWEEKVRERKDGRVG